MERTSEDQGRLRPDAVHSSLPVAAGVHVLGWGGAPSEGVVQGPAGAAIDALTRGCDLVVVDLPRQLGEVAAAAICRCDFIVLVTPRTSVAVAAASRLLGASELDGPCIELVTRGPSPGGLSAPDVGELLGLTLVADSAADPGVVRRLERGCLRSDLAVGCGTQVKRYCAGSSAVHAGLIPCHERPSLSC